MAELIKWLNNNQGVIEAIGLFLVIPLAILSERLLSRLRAHRSRAELRSTLLHELWININFVAQIEESYRKNLADVDTLHVPHYPPRTVILRHYVQHEPLGSLNQTERQLLIEGYAGLDGLREEFVAWRNRLLSSSIVHDKEVYKALSDTMLTYIEPTMRNLLDLWVVIVKDLGGQSLTPQIQQLNKLLLGRIREGKWIRSTYRASYFNDPELLKLPKLDVILCWKNDWPECPKEVLEIRDLVLLHESWRATKQPKTDKG